MKTLKQRLADQETVPVFTAGRVPHPIVIEVFGLAGGFRGFWLDQEHVALTTDQIATAALAGRAHGLDCFVRTPPVGYWQVTQCLEAGASGVMGAQIRSADEAARYVSWARFAPAGSRGLNTGGRDAAFTMMLPAAFVERANRDVFVAIQIETTGALERADEIAAIDGVDLLFIGPADLSLALGVVGQFHAPRLWEAIERVAAACRGQGKPWGAVLPDREFAERALEAGCRLPTFGNDILAVRRGVESIKSVFAGCFPTDNT